MSIISHYNENENGFSSTVDNFLKENRIGFLLKQSNFYKEKGISCYAVFKFLFTLVFSGNNLYRILESQNSNLPFAKDVIYRFLNSIYYNWQKFLMLLASSIIRSKLVGLTSDNRVFARYIMLAVENRNSKDLRTIGGLFYYFCDELQDIKFIEALQLLIDALKTALREKLVLSKEAISDFLDYFMSCLPTFLKEKLALCSCES